MGKNIQTKFCKCGCGEITRGGNFCRGHSQRVNPTTWTEEMRLSASSSHKGKNNILWSPIGKGLICKYCGQTYDVQPAIAGISKYCSRECKDKARSLYYKGKNNPFYGKKHSAKTRKNMSLHHADFSGSKNPNWRGGKKAEQYRGRYWWFVRLIRLSVDNYRCLSCGTHKDTPNLRAHEVIPFKEHKGSLIKNLNNLITLCQSCHCTIEQRRGRYNFNEAFKLMDLGTYNLKRKFDNNFRGVLNFEDPKLIKVINIARRVDRTDEEAIDDMVDYLKLIFATRGYRDVRDAIKVARLSSTKEEVDKIIETMVKYQEA